MVVNKSKKFTLKTLRKKLKMSQEAFAQALRVRRATISDWENGKHRPTLDDEQLEVLAKMLKAANMELIDLFDKAVA